MKLIKSRILTGMFAALFMVFGILPSPALAQWGDSRTWHMGPGMMGGWSGWGGWGMGWMMLVFWILVLVGLILLIRWMLQITQREKNAGGGGDRAMAILKERYARGEMDKNEFERMKSDLKA